MPLKQNSFYCYDSRNEKMSRVTVLEMSLVSTKTNVSSANLATRKTVYTVYFK